MNILDIIKERRSVRSFNGELLSPEMVEKLNEAINESYDPFGGNTTIRIKEFDLKAGYKPSTYGMINGATNFFLLGIANDETSAISAGFRFEQVVLKSWELGLGTCWIAATFKGSDFDKGETWPDGEELKIICPVGVPVKQSLKEKMTRLTLGSKKRKAFKTLFFTDDFKESLSPDCHFGLPLEMLRLAPSSTNSQPWRALVAGDTVHFYYKPKSAASVVDTAIGMSHFWLAEEYLGRKGSFFKTQPTITPPEDWIYLYSFKEEK